MIPKDQVSPFMEGIPSGAGLILMWLWAYADLDQHRFTFVSGARIARELHMSDRNVRKQLVKLQQVGAIKRASIKGKFGWVLSIEKPEPQFLVGTTVPDNAEPQFLSVTKPLNRNHSSANPEPQFLALGTTVPPTRNHSSAEVTKKNPVKKPMNKPLELALTNEQANKSEDVQKRESGTAYVKRIFEHWQKCRKTVKPRCSINGMDKKAGKKIVEAAEFFRDRYVLGTAKAAESMLVAYVDWKCAAAKAGDVREQDFFNQGSLWNGNSIPGYANILDKNNANATADTNQARDDAHGTPKRGPTAMGALLFGGGCEVKGHPDMEHPMQGQYVHPPRYIDQGEWSSKMHPHDRLVSVGQMYLFADNSKNFRISIDKITRRREIEAKQPERIQKVSV